MAELTITRLDTSTTTGPNQRPLSGYVKFSDGKFYYWSVAFGPDPKDPYRLSLSARTHQGAGRTSRFFRSPRRLALLVKELDG